MINILNFCCNYMGNFGIVIAKIAFIIITAIGVGIAIRGRGTMMWIVSVCSFWFGAIGGAMIGILAFNSIILMIILAAVFAVLMVVVVHHFRSIGYFIGISSLGWLLCRMLVTNISSDVTLSDNILLFLTLVVALVMGIMAACRSKYIITFITSISGGVIASMGLLAVFGAYFTDIKTWIVAAVFAAIGIIVQFSIYDLRPSKKHK